MPIIALGHCRDKERRLRSQRRQEIKQVRGTLMEERIDSLEGDGHLQRGGDADGARVRVTVYSGSQTHGPLRTMSKQRCYTKALRPPPYSKSPTQWCEVSGWDTLEKREFAQSCPTLCHPVDCSPPGSSVHGTLQARILEWVASSFSRGPSRHQGSNPGLWHCGQRL